MVNHPNDRPPNFWDAEGNFYLVRCFVCSTCKGGTENYLPAAASGQCAWCGASVGEGRPIKEETPGE